MIKKILVACDSFKGSIQASDACAAVKEGLSKVNQGEWEIELAPMADGGEGTGEILAAANNGWQEPVTVLNPLLEKTTSILHLFKKDGEVIGVIEAANVCGIEMIKKEQRNPLDTSSYGMGELLKYGINKGIRKFIIALGGTVTNDGGIGMLQSLGANIVIEDEVYKEKVRGRDVLRIQDIDFSRIDHRVYECELMVASDVENVLLGANGATYMYGPQKGILEKDLDAFEASMRKYSEILRNRLEVETMDICKTGAGGGLGAGFLALDAKLLSGIDLVMEYTSFEAKLQDVDLIITGEGSIDRQTEYGKVISGVTKSANIKKIPVIALGGSILGDIENLYRMGLTATFSIMKSVSSLDKALDEGECNIIFTAENIGRLLVSFA